MARTLKYSGIIILLISIAFSMGCLKRTIGGGVGSTGTNAMEDGLPGSSSGETSIIGDVIALVTGVFSGTKDFDSLLSYFIGLALYLIGTVIQGAKSKKRLRLEGDLKGVGIEVITNVIQKYMDGKFGVGGRKVAAEIAASIKSDASKSTAVGAKIHEAVKKARNKENVTA